MIVAVYGTLRKGERNSHMLGKSKQVDRAYIAGTMYLVSRGFPGVVLGGERPFVAELYDVNDDILSRLDGLEGYYPEFPHLSMYIRRTLPAVVGTKNSFSNVQVYEWNGETDNVPVLLAGDWMERHRDIERIDEELYQRRLTRERGAAISPGGSGRDLFGGPTLQQRAPLPPVSDPPEAEDQPVFDPDDDYLPEDDDDF